MADGREHRHIGPAIGKGTTLVKIDTFTLGVLPNAAGLFSLRQQIPMNASGSHVILELEPVAYDFVDAEVQRDGTDREIERSLHENVTVTQIARRID